MRLALAGYGSVGRAFADLLNKRRSSYPFLIAGIHTRRHGTAYHPHGLGLDPAFGPAAPSFEEFLDLTQPDVLLEITTLNPESGQPAIGHIQSAFDRGIHVITANKGPIAYAYAELRDHAKRAQVEFRFESTVMDGTPVFNSVRNNLPGLSIHGFSGVLNSTSKVVIAAMQRGLSMADGIREAQSLGIAEADVSYDIDGWDSTAKTAALANVLMSARTNPQRVERTGLGNLTTGRVLELAQNGQTVVQVSRAARSDGGVVHLQVKPEILPEGDLHACVRGASNLLLLHTDLMGTIGTVSINPGVEQTAYGLFSDLVDIARCL